mgnify:FL=1
MRFRSSPSQGNLTENSTFRRSSFQRAELCIMSNDYSSHEIRTQIFNNGCPEESHRLGDFVRNNPKARVSPCFTLGRG